MNRLHFNKKYHCNKNGAKRPSSWSDTPFWPISLKENAKGVPKKWISYLHQIYSLNPGYLGIIKEVLPSCSGMKRGSALGAVA
jgi:hypothetical protein